MTSGVSITMQSPTQIAPRRYFVRLSEANQRLARAAGVPVIGKRVHRCHWSLLVCDISQNSAARA